jgi:hypothetical protein
MAKRVGASVGEGTASAAAGWHRHFSGPALWRRADARWRQPATRRVIDVSTDGRNNMGRPAFRARDELVARGITINGLAIANEWPTLDVYLERQVTGGPSNFVVKADSYDDFGAAMQRKLIREIVGPGLT